MRLVRCGVDVSREVVRVRRLVLLQMLPTLPADADWVWLRSGLVPPREAVALELAELRVPRARRRRARRRRARVAREL